MKWTCLLLLALVALQQAAAFHSYDLARQDTEEEGPREVAASTTVRILKEDKIKPPVYPSPLPKPTPKEPKEPKDPKEPKEPKEPKSRKLAFDLKEGPSVVAESSTVRVLKEDKVKPPVYPSPLPKPTPKEPKEPKDPKEPKEPKEPKSRKLAFDLKRTWDD